ncbi:hypothetical protein, partial [Pseudomonas syringae group genomosp. 7]|uniref:hypothetical protein n=1 Tax=Pseudomonas syringae group genomosp. 7 TaxID=251699 RepID=UPI00376FBFA9
MCLWVCCWWGCVVGCGCCWVFGWCGLGLVVFFVVVWVGVVEGVLLWGVLVGGGIFVGFWGCWDLGWWGGCWWWFWGLWGCLWLVWCGFCLLRRFCSWLCGVRYLRLWVVVVCVWCVGCSSFGLLVFRLGVPQTHE